MPIAVPGRIWPYSDDLPSSTVHYSGLAWSKGRGDWKKSWGSAADKKWVR